MRPLLLAALVGLLFALGCASEPPPDPKKQPPRKMVKPGEGGPPRPPNP
jgi:hypothetical protein